jgi:BON domain
MGRLMFMLLITLLTDREVPTGKTVGRTVDDAVITAGVKTELATDQAASLLTKINVDTNRGTVSPNGNVESAAAKQQATELTEQVKCVTDVINNLASADGEITGEQSSASVSSSRTLSRLQDVSFPSPRGHLLSRR